MSSYVIHKEVKNGYKLEILNDDCPMSPREWDNLGTMICFHRGYRLGDKHNYKEPESFLIDIWESEATEQEKLDFILNTCKGNISQYREILEHSYDRSINLLFETTVERIQTVTDLPDSVIYLNLHAYEHGGITMNTSGFSCGRDSGQVGWIYVTKSKIESEGLKDKSKEQILEYLNNEVKTYAKYLEGDVYGFVVTKTNTCNSCHHTEDEILESCWGFFGIDRALQEGRILLELFTKE
jgi:hypothetical protein